MEKRFAYLDNKEIVFHGASSNIFNILGYFGKIIRELNPKEYKEYLNFSKSLISKGISYQDVINQLEQKFQCKIVV